VEDGNGESSNECSRRCFWRKMLQRGWTCSPFDRANQGHDSDQSSAKNTPNPTNQRPSCSWYHSGLGQWTMLHTNKEQTLAGSVRLRARKSTKPIDLLDRKIRMDLTANPFSENLPGRGLGGSVHRLGRWKLGFWCPQSAVSRRRLSLKSA
jgi:hypothetical protein